MIYEKVGQEPLHIWNKTASTFGITRHIMTYISYNTWQFSIRVNRNQLIT